MVKVSNMDYSQILERSRYRALMRPMMGVAKFLGLGDNLWVFSTHSDRDGAGP